MSTRKTTGHTLIEVSCIAATLAVVGALVLPILAAGREQSRRRLCMSNLRRLGQALQIYAQDDPGRFPAVSITVGLPPSTLRRGSVQFFDPADRTMQPSTTGVPSPTVDMWVLIRGSYATPRQYICSSTPDTPDPASDTSAYFDFLTMNHLSYAYQYQHDANRAIIGRSSEPTFPVMADGNPYIKGDLDFGVSIQADRQSQSRGNSVNHTDREGQNVLYQAGHVFFERGPDVGLFGKSLGLLVSRGRDNCYTVAESRGSVDPGNGQPTANRVDLGGRSDACLVP